MNGIDFNKPIIYKHSSLRFFDKNEHHISRLCKDDILFMVYEGILRFSVDNIDYEIHPGEYFIQKKGLYQKGTYASDSPKYLYVHFLADWTDTDNALAMQGTFDYLTLKPLIESLNQLSHSNATMIEQTAKFYEILLKLQHIKKEITVADQIADYISKKLLDNLTLDMICKEFNFSKNHVINLFKKEYKMTPFEYMNFLKIKQAESLLEVTSESVESICYQCGFHDYPYFYKLFYRANKLSPTEWRNQKRLTPT